LEPNKGKDGQIFIPWKVFLLMETSLLADVTLDQTPKATSNNVYIIIISNSLFYKKGSSWSIFGVHFNKH